MSDGESAPGIQGGMVPFCVRRRMKGANAWAVLGDLIEKGATPPGVWQPAHFAAKTGATSFQLGVAAARASPPLPPRVASPSDAATASRTPAASAIRRTSGG